MEGICVRTMRDLHLVPVRRDIVVLDKADHGPNVEVASLDHLGEDKPLPVVLV